MTLWRKQLLIFCRSKETWYRLSRDQQNAIIAKLQDVDRKTGARRIIDCWSGWANTQWASFGVVEIADIDSTRKHSELMAEFNWRFEFFWSFTLLGSKSGAQTRAWFEVAHRRRAVEPDQPGALGNMQSA